MSTSYHCGLSVRGALAWGPRELVDACDWITPAGGGRYTPVQLRNALMDELAAGHEEIPIGDCDNWDFISGCQGHRDEATRSDPATGPDKSRHPDTPYEETLFADAVEEGQP